MRALALLLALAIGACSCATEPVPHAQAAVVMLQADYRAAKATEDRYSARPDCEEPDPLLIVECAQPKLVLAARRAGYDAEAALVTADSERTQKALDTARQKVDAYVMVVWGLQ